jgi:hypothetical protein
VESVGLALLSAAVGEPFGYVRNDGRAAVVTRGTDGHVYQIAQIDAAGGPGFWLPPADLSGSTGAPAASGNPIGYKRSSTVSSVLYRSTSNKIVELAFSGGGWNDDVPSPGAPDAASTASPAGYVRPGDIPAMLYRSTSSDVIELTLNGSTWSAVNLTTGALGAPPKAHGNPFGYVRPGNIPTVVHNSTGKEIIELTLSGTTWSSSNLSAMTGAPAAASDPVGYTRSDSVPAVVYRSGTSIIELALVGGSWVDKNLSILVTGEPAAAGDAFGYVRHDGVNCVVYRGTNGNIAQLALVGGTWLFSDLTMASGIHIAAASDPMAYNSPQFSSVVFRGTDNQVYGLFRVGSGVWSGRKLS